MTLDELLQNDNATIAPREEHIRATVAAARASFLRAESEMPLSRTAFLSAQLALIQKRWWLAQALLLVLVALALPGLAEIALMARRARRYSGALRHPRDPGICQKQQRKRHGD